MRQSAKFIVKLWENGQEVELHQADKTQLSDNDRVSLYLIESIVWDGRDPVVTEYTWHMGRHSLSKVRSMHQLEVERNRSFSVTVYTANRYHWQIDDTDKAIKVESKPIPCPNVKDGVIVQFIDGHWCKQVKSGWKKL